jgi:peptide/nickel transport system ATP-binding protein
MAMLFITHNLGVVAEIADTIAVMYAGRVVEAGTVAEVFRAPRHPYTRGLLAAMPRIGRAGAMRRAGLELPSIPGIVPALAERPPGCSFAPRCALAAPECRAGVPGLELVGAGHAARCWRWREVAP